MFNPARLSLARMRRRLTAKALAEKAGLVPDTISRLENGLHPPDAATVARLAESLDFPVIFFERGDPYDVDTEAVSFRSFSKMSWRAWP
jgi:transcriptional regulator with XRE-family HTH domain